jgi:hypothetical protein
MELAGIGRVETLSSRERSIMLRLSCALLLVSLANCAGAGAPLAMQASAPARPPVAPALAPVASGAALPRILLDSHNLHRRAAGVPLLTWNAQLAADAAAHARALSQTGQLVHSPRASRPGIGENLWVGTAGAFAPDAGVASWAAEKSDYREGAFPNVSRTGNWLDVSHYTQMIWRTTTHVGCAWARSPRWDALVCRYSPKGNRDGQRPR